MKLVAVLVLALVAVAQAETLGADVRAVRMFHDDGAGHAGAEAPDRTFAPGAGRVHIQADLVAPHREPAAVTWTVYQLTASGEGVQLMEHTAQAANFESVTFTALRTPEWTPGRYRIDLALDGTVVQGTGFAVVRDPAGVRVATVGLHACDAAGQAGAPVTWFRHNERRIWLRAVASGCAGVPFRATIALLDGDTAGAPFAAFEDPGAPDASRNVDMIFDSAADWVPGFYRVEISAGEKPVVTVDLRIE